MIRVRLAAAALLAALLLGGCVSHSGRVAGEAQPAPQTRDFRLQENVAYVGDDWPERLRGDLYRPAGAGPFPGVLLVHGGGWARGEPDDMADIAERLARRGFLVFNVGYRFAPDTVFPGQIHDLQMALRWLRDNADRLSLDPTRIGGMGYSAGAHLVALLGMIEAGDELDQPDGGPDTRLQAVVAGGTPTDLRKFEGGTLVPQFLGTSREDGPDIYARASPVTHIHEQAPPVFLYHGGLDMLVPPDHAEDMKAELDAAGVPAELYLVRGLGHVALFLADRGAVDAGIDFLDRVLR